MATVASTPPRVYTPEDLLKVDDRPMPELVDGRLVERPMGQEVDSIAVNIAGNLGVYIRSRSLGRINGARCGYQIFPDDPNKVRVPAVSFTRRERWPSAGPAQGHARVAPDLVVDVVSPNDQDSMVESKLRDFLAAGVPLVWIVSPDTRTVMVYRADGSSSRLTESDTIDGGDILPGFSCKVSAFFV